MAETKTKTRFELQVKPRTEFGKQAMKRLRAAGDIPVVFYAGGEEAQAYQIAKPDMRLALLSGEKIFNVTLDGEQRRAMIKDIQYHPVTDDVIHVDFQVVRLRDIIEISVPLILEGSAPGIKEGGIIQQLVHEINIRCKGENVPDGVVVNISEMNIGDSIHASELESDVYEIQAADELTLVTLTHPQKMEVEAAVEEEDEDLEFEEEEGEASDSDEESSED